MKRMAASFRRIVSAVFVAGLLASFHAQAEQSAPGTKPQTPDFPATRALPKDGPATIVLR